MVSAGRNLLVKSFVLCLLNGTFDRGSQVLYRGAHATAYDYCPNFLGDLNNYAVTKQSAHSLLPLNGRYSDSARPIITLNK